MGSPENTQEEEVVTSAAGEAFGQQRIWILNSPGFLKEEWIVCPQYYFPYEIWAKET